MILIHKPCPFGGGVFPAMQLNKSSKSEETRLLESILTIDGLGRPAKARALLALIKQTFPDDPSSYSGEFYYALKEISERKFF